MSSIQQQVRQAFDEVKAPEQIKQQTLAFIEAARPADESIHTGCDDARVEESLPSQSCAKMPSQEVPASAVPASVRFAASRVVRRRRGIRAFAACIVLALACFGGYGLYQQPTAYVGIDVNPSVELSVNWFGTVVAAEALNDDGKTLLQDVSLVNYNYTEALAVLTESESFAPYVQDDSYIAISVTSDNERQAEELRTQSDTQLAALPCQGECSVVDEATHDAATAAGMGVGRYRAAQELMALDPDITLEECATLSMRQLRDRIATYGGGSSESVGQGGSGAGVGSGSGNRYGQAANAGQGSERGTGAGSGTGQGSGQGAGSGSGSGMGEGSGSGAGQGSGSGSGSGAGQGSGSGSGMGQGAGSGSGTAQGWAQR